MMCLTFGVYSFQVTLGPLTITETESAFEVCYIPFVAYDFFMRGLHFVGTFITNTMILDENRLVLRR